jgi:hypothetical protein
MQSKGAYAYGGYPTSMISFSSRRPSATSNGGSAAARDPAAPIERAMYAPVMDLRTLNGIGPRIAKHTITDVWMSPFPSYEDMELKN